MFFRTGNTLEVLGSTSWLRSCIAMLNVRLDVVFRFTFSIWLLLCHVERNLSLSHDLLCRVRRLSLLLGMSRPASLQALLAENRYRWRCRQHSWFWALALIPARVFMGPTSSITCDARSGLEAARKYLCLAWHIHDRAACGMNPRSNGIESSESQDGRNLRHEGIFDPMVSDGALCAKA